MWIAVILIVLLYELWDIYRYIFRRRQPEYLKLILDKKGHAEDYYLRRDSEAEKLRNSPCESFEICSGRGERLCGWYYPCGEGYSKKLAFIVHGYHSEHAETAGMFREIYHSRGFDIFSPDNTASGESGGRAFGYDVFESADCLRWLDFLQEKFGADVEIVLHGFSLGGAAVMKMSDRVPDCVKFIVEDSGFIDAREILRKKSGALYPLMEWMQKVIGHCDLADTYVGDNLKNSRLPFLIVHGEGDKTVPFSMAPRIFELCPNDKDKLFTPKAKHIETVHYNRTEYEAKIDEFIAKYI